MCANLIELLEAWPLSAKHERDPDQKFLQRKVFAGLKNRNNGFDSSAIPHFSATDFLVVINRCAHFAIEIVGIEVFSEGKQFVDTEISTEPGYEWARRFARRYLSDGDITLCATYNPSPSTGDEDRST